MTGNEGIKPIEPQGRNLGGMDFFLLWAGAAVSLAEIWAGGLLVPMGFATGFLVILLGHLIGNTPMALGGIMGSKTGLPTMVAVRPSFGIRGSYFATILNLVQLVGWTGVMLWIGGQAANSVWPMPTVGFRGWVLVAGIATTLWALVGRRYWKWLQRFAVTALICLCVIMTYVVLHEYGLNRLLNVHAKGDMPFMVGLDLVIAMPISWLPLVCDYSRYGKSAKTAFWGTWVGYFIFSSWMYLIGLAAALATQSPTPESMVLELMVKLGLVVPAMIIVLFSTFTTTFLDIYSTAVSALNIWPRAGERRGSLICGLLGIVLALMFPATAYEGFLLFIGSVFCPLFGVVLADYFFLRRGRYFEAGKDAEKRYRYLWGFNPWAFLAWAVGFGFYHYLQRQTAWGSSIPSFLATGLLYLVLMGLFHRNQESSGDLKGGIR
ncbi:MAG: putative hydroxymethylpyrimidine transporter CytX [Deltaproteobacteria bacterium]|nr:putative hydroxymethylpyrimidine transporter CytX [Deltaproteobacteria bacterium]